MPVAQYRRSAQHFLEIIGVVITFCVASTIASPAQVFTTLVNFDGSNGSAPLTPLIQGTDRNIYGTESGGFQFNSNIFTMTPAGILTNLYTFCSLPNCADGSWPAGALVQANDGNFYGVTQSGHLGILRAIDIWRHSPIPELMVRRIPWVQEP